MPQRTPPLWEQLGPMIMQSISENAKERRAAERKKERYNTIKGSLQTLYGGYPGPYSPEEIQSQRVGAVAALSNEGFGVSPSVLEQPEPVQKADWSPYMKMKGLTDQEIETVTPLIEDLTEAETMKMIGEISKRPVNEDADIEWLVSSGFLTQKEGDKLKAMSYVKDRIGLPGMKEWFRLSFGTESEDVDWTIVNKILHDKDGNLRPLQDIDPDERAKMHMHGLSYSAQDAVYGIADEDMSPQQVYRMKLNMVKEAIQNATMFMMFSDEFKTIDQNGNKVLDFNKYSDRLSQMMSQFNDFLGNNEPPEPLREPINAILELKLNEQFSKDQLRSFMLEARNDSTTIFHGLTYDEVNFILQKVYNSGTEASGNGR